MYITFVDSSSAIRVLKEQPHIIDNKNVIVQLAHSGCEPDLAYEHIELPTPNAYMRKEIVELKSELFDSINESLNEDCISMVMSYLNVFELIDMAEHSSKFARLSQQQRVLHLLPEITAKKQIFTLAHLRDILALYGHSILELILGLHMPSYLLEGYDDIIEVLVAHIGPQLRSLSLIDLYVRSYQFKKLKPIILNLRHLTIGFCNNDKTASANLIDVWPNLQSLRISIYCPTQSLNFDFIDIHSEKNMAFPKLKSLLVESRFLSQHFFQAIVKITKALQSLVVIVISSDSINLCDFSLIIQLQHLTKLHLSITSAFIIQHNVCKILCRMKSLQYLTMELTGDRILFSENLLATFREGFETLIEFRISGMGFDQNKIGDLIRTVKNLDHFHILNSGIRISNGFIDDLIAARTAQLSRREPSPSNKSPLRFTIDLRYELSDDLVREHLI